MAAQTNPQGPLETLTALGGSPIKVFGNGPEDRLSGTAQAERLRREHDAPAALVQEVEALGDRVKLIELPGVPIWIYDNSWSQGCIRTIAAFVPPGTAAQKIDLPSSQMEGLCPTRFRAVDIDGKLALFNYGCQYEFNDIACTLAILPFDGPKVDPFCNVNIHYAVSLRSEHAFCHEGVDCGDIMRLAEKFADRLHASADAVIPDGGVSQDTVNQLHTAQLRSAYDRMQQTGEGQADSAISLTFNLTLGDDAKLFAFRAWGGDIYLARLGHGHRGALIAPGYNFTAHGLSDDRLVTIGDVLVDAIPGTITSIEVMPEMAGQN